MDKDKNKAVSEGGANIHLKLYLHRCSEDVPLDAEKNMSKVSMFDIVQRSFTNVLLQVGDVLPVLSQGLEDLQAISEVLVARLVV